jgi:hypothetical protein
MERWIEGARKKIMPDCKQQFEIPSSATGFGLLNPLEASKDAYSEPFPYMDTVTVDGQRWKRSKRCTDLATGTTGKIF